ncbi:MAG TPA: DUF3147 family protein [Gammaproteobacteria bacterium]|nr:DUF3147 family protein [Gammaproteobacteria bacterium]
MNSSILYLTLKVLISAILIVAISEIAKRSTLLGGILASVPLTSVLAILWLYSESKDTQKIIALSYDIFWLVLPSLIFFLALPFLLKKSVNFYVALGSSITLTAIGYGIMIFIMHLE